MFMDPLESTADLWLGGILVNIIILYCWYFLQEVVYAQLAIDHTETN